MINQVLREWTNRWKGEEVKEAQQEQMGESVHYPITTSELTCVNLDSLQEADMDEEGDAERAAQWDLAAADAAYKAQVEAALAQQRAVEEEHRLLLEQLEVVIIIMTILQSACCSCLFSLAHA